MCSVAYGLRVWEKRPESSAAGSVAQTNSYESVQRLTEAL